MRFTLEYGFHLHRVLKLFLQDILNYGKCEEILDFNLYTFEMAGI